MLFSFMISGRKVRAEQHSVHNYKQSAVRPEMENKMTNDSVQDKAKLGTLDLIQAENRILDESYTAPGMRELARQAAAEGCVLLKNDGTLPLDLSHNVSVFGRCQLDWFFMGAGSGGEAFPPYYVHLIDGLKDAGASYNTALADIYSTWCSSPKHLASRGDWLHWSFHYPEMPVSRELAEAARGQSDTALLVIGRSSGENEDWTPERGAYYLTDTEEELLECVTSVFDKTVLILNIGCFMDLSFIEKYGERIGAVLLARQGGMESGHAVCDILYGAVCPSGKLGDTFASDYRDYPSSHNFGNSAHADYDEGIFIGYRYFDKYAPGKVLFPFGYGLSYTSFNIRTESFCFENNTVSVNAEVTNTGDRSGKEVVMLWCAPPSEGMEKPKRILAAFAKTGELKPGCSETLSLSCSSRYFSSFSEELHAFILEPGTWTFTVNEIPAGSFSLSGTEILEKVIPAMMPDTGLRKRILQHLPEETHVPAAADPHFSKVITGELSLDAFLASLTPEELEALSRGQGMMDSPYGAKGNAGAFGGITPGLNAKGVPPVITSDGPSGLRLSMHTSLIPSAAVLACSWNTVLVEALYGRVGDEMIYWGIDVLLCPGMNLHRDPLCGRNFEYYSEDPVLSGRMAAAAVRGIQSRGKAACPKHLCCNNQETGRNVCDSRVSERALRELYLRNFEICIHESTPLTVMSSYNRVNGVWSHYNYDLLTTVLRGEWGFDGVVITDWWMQPSVSPEFPQLRDNAYRVRAQADVLMPGDMDHFAGEYRPDETLLETLGTPGGITRGELQRTARNVLKLILKLNQSKSLNDSTGT